MESMLIQWIQEHLLTLVALTVTVFFLLHYLLDRDYGHKLSKRYKSSIYEAQSKIFLNATQYLIDGQRDLAIKEFLNAVDLSRETIEIYFALGGLFRSNGEIDKAISIHRSLIARDKISESARIAALRELALDFDKGGFVDKALETYQDVLRLNSNNPEVIQSICRIYEDIEDWDQAYLYRLQLSKFSMEDQSDTISQILVQKAKQLMASQRFAESWDCLDDAFKFAPSISAKILRLKLLVSRGNMEDAKFLLFEIIKEHPVYTAFVFASLFDVQGIQGSALELYLARLTSLKDYFLNFQDDDFITVPSIVLAKVRLLKESERIADAYQLLKQWLRVNRYYGDEVLKIEFAKILIDLGLKDEALEYIRPVLENYHESLARYYCSQCGYNSDHVFWRCPQCKKWETIQFRWKI